MTDIQQAKREKALTCLTDGTKSDDSTSPTSKKKTTSDKPKKGPSQREQLISSTAGDKFWRDSEGVGYVTVTTGGVPVHHRIRSTNFRNELVMRVYKSTGSGASKQALEEALQTCEAQAQCSGDVAEPVLRSAFANSAVYYDLCDTESPAIEVTKNGWSEILDPPVKFVRSRSMMPAAKPEHGGTSAMWLQFLETIGVTKPEAQLLLSAWCVSVIVGRGPYPVLLFIGTQGSGKSTRARALKRLLDPAKNELRSQPKNAEDFFVAVKNTHLPMIDNVSSVLSWLSDLICMVATGVAYSARELYSNHEETIISACRPLCLNGITEFAHRPDLLDRSVLIETKSPVERREESELWVELDALRPKLLGFLFSAVVHYLDKVDGVRADKTNLARMADFHILGSAVEQFFGFAEGDFDLAYLDNFSNASNIALESNPLAALIRDHVESISGAKTPTKLLEALKNRCPEGERKFLPRNPKALTDQLKRIEEPLKRCGITFTIGKSDGSRWINLQKHQGRTEADRVAAGSQDFSPSTLTEPELGFTFGQSGSQGSQKKHTV